MTQTYHILKNIVNCDSCKFRNNCNEHKLCGSYYPVNEDKYCDSIMDYIHNKVSTTNEKYLTRHPVLNSDLGLVHDDIYTLDQYYVDMINDNLRLVRNGDVAYCYKIEQIADMYRHQPNIKIELFRDGVFYIT